MIRDEFNSFTLFEEADFIKSTISVQMDYADEADALLFFTLTFSDGKNWYSVNLDKTTQKQDITIEK